MAGMGILSFYRWGDGEYSVGTNRGLYRMRQKDGAATWQRELFDAQSGEIKSVSAMLRRKDGTLWLAGKGITRVDAAAGGGLVIRDRYTAADGLPTIGIDLLAEDGQGNIWGATAGLESSASRNRASRRIFAGRPGRRAHRGVDGGFARASCAW